MVPTVERGLRLVVFCSMEMAGREPFDGVDVGALDLIEKLAGVGGEGFDVAALAFGVDGVEGERAFAGAAEAGYHGKGVAGDADADVLEVMLARAAYRNVTDGHGLGRFWEGQMTRRIQVGTKACRKAGFRGILVVNRMDGSTKQKVCENGRRRRSAPRTPGSRVERLFGAGARSGVVDFYVEWFGFVDAGVRVGRLHGVWGADGVLDPPPGIRADEAAAQGGCGEDAGGAGGLGAVFSPQFSVVSLPLTLGCHPERSEGSAFAFRALHHRMVSHLCNTMRVMHEGSYFVYIMASRSRTLYIGVTGNLHKRVFEHKWRSTMASPPDITAIAWCGLRAFRR